MKGSPHEEQRSEGNSLYHMLWVEQEDGWNWEGLGEWWWGRVSEQSVRLAMSGPSSYPCGHIICGELGVALPRSWSYDQLCPPLEFHCSPLHSGYGASQSWPLGGIPV